MDAAPLDPPEFADVRQIAQRLCRVDELLHGCVAQAEPQPPRRFLVSPMPVEQLGQEPSRRLVLRSEGPIGRYLLRQRVNPGLRLSLPRRELFRRGPILRLRPRQVPALLGDCGRPQSFEPRAEPEGGHAVVAVVGSQLVEQALLPRRQPLLVLHHGEPCLGDRTLALGQVELLDLLDGVRLDRRPKTLAHHLVQVHQHPAPQQAVYLVLAGRVALHQPLQGGRFIGRVVVDVHPGIAIQPRDDQVDELLEGRLLVGAIMPPDRSVDGRPLDFFDGAEEIFQPAVERPRIRLDVEEEVEGRRLRQGGQATTGLAVTWRDELLEQLARPATRELEPSLFPDAGERPRIHVGHGLVGGELSEGGQGADSVVAKPLGMDATHSGHQR